MGEVQTDLVVGGWGGEVVTIHTDLVGVGAGGTHLPGGGGGGGHGTTLTCERSPKPLLLQERHSRRKARVVAESALLHRQRPRCASCRSFEY